MLTTPHHKKHPVTKSLRRKPRNWADILVRPKQRKRYMRFGTWNVRSLYRAGSLTAPSRELARRKLDLEGVQDVRWDKWCSVRAGG